MNIYKAYLIVLIVALITFCFRFLPFAFYKYLQNNSTLNYIRLFLPASIMLLLAIYTLKDTSLSAPSYGLIEFISVLTVVIIHVKFRNALLSIAIGTGLYVTYYAFMK